MFSRAVRWPVARRRATAFGRASSSARARRSSTSFRSGRMWSRSIACSWRRAAAEIGALLDEHQRMVLEHRVAGGDRERAHDAADRGADRVLHLHRLQHQHFLAGEHGRALGDAQRDDRALHRRAQRHRAVRARSLLPACVSFLFEPALPTLAIQHDAQRIGGFELGAGARDRPPPPAARNSARLPAGPQQARRRVRR